ncbi:MAG: rhomboid family intramembrane serine protease [Candidatus Obscuribacterales bacterium]|nr:rhomboid family intramembrane serine protease [Candidatus Obscuribacterales bacterium]
MQQTLPELILQDKPVRPEKWTWTPAEPVTGVLIILSVATFAAIFTVNGNFGAFLLPVPERLLWWGANYMPFTFGMGEYWRLATGLFAHAGILHLLTNLYVLQDLGCALERNIGWQRYMLLVLASGAAASLSSVTQDPTFVSCGLSGIIFAIVSCLFLMSGSAQGKELVFARHRWLVVIFIGYMLALGFITQGIDNAAHVAGLLVGVVFGLVYSKRGWSGRWNSIDSVLAIAASALSVAVFSVEAFVLTGSPYLVGLADCRKAMTIAKWDKNYLGAISLMNKAIGTQTDDPLYYLTRAGFYADAKRYQSAVDDYTSVLAINPEERGALAGRSIAYHHLGDEAKAIADLDRLIAVDPKRAITYNNRAWSLIAMGESNNALSDCERALSIDPSLATAYDTKAVALLNLKRLQEALACVNRSISLESDGAAYYHRAEILLSLGKLEDSVQDFRKAEKLNYKPEAWELQTALVRSRAIGF